jgi:3-hydroxyacyl-[acyl-carrier-protein] dehydratase
LAAAERHFSLDHPAAQGHFPGDPIIPGAVLLHGTLQAIAARIGAAPSAVHLRSAKFLRPTRPGDRLAIEFSSTAHGEIRFECTVDGKPVLTGQFRWQDRPTAG